jgi:hypothetical protein
MAIETAGCEMIVKSSWGMDLMLHAHPPEGLRDLQPTP